MLTALVRAANRLMDAMLCCLHIPGEDNEEIALSFVAHFAKWLHYESQLQSELQPSQDLTKALNFR